jgi:type I restriction enzyme S subunit
MFDDAVQWMTLGEVSTYARERVDACELNAQNYVGVDNLLPDKRGKTISNYVPSEGRLIKYHTGDILIGNIRPYLKKIWLATERGGTNGDVLVVHVNDKKIITPHYLYHVLSSDNFFAYNVQHSKGAKMPRGDKNAIMKYSVPVPPLTEQERIVAILDRFDALCSDITSGLPAEIEARRKQYEYYRDKLLSFKEATA